MFTVGWARRSVSDNIILYDVMDANLRVITSYNSITRAQGLVSYMNTRKFYEFG